MSLEDIATEDHVGVDQASSSTVPHDPICASQAPPVTPPARGTGNDYGDLQLRLRKLVGHQSMSFKSWVRALARFRAAGAAPPRDGGVRQTSVCQQLLRVL